MADTSQPNPDARAKLVYVISAAHSGSTLLDILIGTIGEAFSCGELAHLPWQLQTRHETSTERGAACSCLNSFAECPAWSRIVAALSETSGFDVAANPFAFDIRLIHPGHRHHRQDLLRKFQPRGAYGYVIQHGIFSPIEHAVAWWYRSAVRNNWRLFDTIARTIGARCIVDSSKNLRRLKLLHTHRSTDMRIIVLMRDIRGVAHSATKRGRDPAKVAAGWVRHYNRTRRVLARMTDVPVLPIQYERLCDDPVATRRTIASLLDLGDPGDELALDTRQHHLVGGNQFRYRGCVEIRRDHAWREGLSAATREAVEQIATKLHPQWAEMGLAALADP